MSADLVVSLWGCQATKRPGLQATSGHPGSLPKPEYVPWTHSPLESTLSQTRTCGLGRIQKPLPTQKSDLKDGGGET